MMDRSIPQIELIRVQNYRALKDVKLDKLTPLTVLLGPNGSGKSTLFDVFAFLSECFNTGLRKAWDKRGRFRELRTRGQRGPIVFELQYREGAQQPLVTYHLEIDEAPGGPFVAAEWLQYRRNERVGKPFKFLDFKQGEGTVVSGEMPEEQDERVREKLSSREMLAVNTLGQLAKHPRVNALRQFISSWYLSYITADNTRGVPEAGPQERLSQTGDNLPNVIQYLRERYPQQLDDILERLKQRIPQLEEVTAKILEDGRLLLQLKDAPFEQPILSKFASDGTLKMLAYLTVLHDPQPPLLIGVEEPENQLHPRLLPELAEECRAASNNTQVMVTTHSPFFLNSLDPKEVWALTRDHHGFTQAIRVSKMNKVVTLHREGLQLGALWFEGHFESGNPEL